MGGKGKESWSRSGRSAKNEGFWVSLGKYNTPRESENEEEGLDFLLRTKMQLGRIIQNFLAGNQLLDHFPWHWSPTLCLRSWLIVIYTLRKGRRGGLAAEHY